MNRTRSETYCKGKTKRGKPCRAAAMDGGLCFFHANPNKAAELGRIGGRRNRRVFTGVANPTRDLKSAKGVLEECARLIENVYAGKISPKIARCVAPLLNLQMRVIQVAELESPIAKLEQARAGSSETPKRQHQWIYMTREVTNCGIVKKASAICLTWRPTPPKSAASTP